MSTTLTLSLAAVLVAGAPAGTLKVTQRHLVPVCRDAAPVPAGTRSWRTGDAPLTLTFAPEAGRQYEVEVRSAPLTFSQRVWPAGAWTPVVRDRTDDRLVGSEPVWGPPPCPVASAQR